MSSEALSLSVVLHAWGLGIRELEKDAESNQSVLGNYQHGYVNPRCETGSTVPLRSARHQDNGTTRRSQNHTVLRHLTRKFVYKPSIGRKEPHTVLGYEQTLSSGL
jgi:hypothetical protein